jgi:hypothetical protein
MYSCNQILSSEGKKGRGTQEMGNAKIWYGEIQMKEAKQLTQ